MLPADWVFSQKAVVFCIEVYSGFAAIQSRVHEVWARAFSSTSMELMSYTPSDCFETFPLPDNWKTIRHSKRWGSLTIAFGLR